MICPICKAELQLNEAKHCHENGVTSPSVVCTAGTCGFHYTEKLDHHDHVVNWEMNAFTKHTCRAKSAEAALARKFNFRMVFPPCQ